MDTESFIVPDYEIELKPGKWSAKKRGITPETAKRVFEKYNYTCVICGLCTTPEMPRDVHGRPIAFQRIDEFLVPTSRRLTLDHIVPKAMRSCNHVPNLIVMCCFCNNKKAALMPRVWLKTLKVELQISLIDAVIEAEMYHVIVSEP